MKTLYQNFIPTLVFCCIIVLSSCTKNVICISPNGDEISETKSFAEINKVSHDFDGNLVIHQISDLEEPYAVISGSSNLVRNLELKRRGTKLIIKDDRCTKNNPDITVDLYVSDLEEISLNASGTIANIDTLFSNQLEVNINGSGTVDLVLECNFTEVDLNGSGDIIFKGKSNEADYSINGSGTIDNYDFEVKDAEVSISGSGMAKVNVTSFLEISISGSGDVYYIGSPVVKSNISGSGSIYKF